MAGKKQQRLFSSHTKPSFSHIKKSDKNYIRNLNHALSHAHSNLSAIDLKKEVVKYLKHLDAHHPMLERIKDIYENRFTSVGKYMYILNHNGEIPDAVLPTLYPALEKIVNAEEEKVAKVRKEAEYLAKKTIGNKPVEEVVKVVVTIQDRLREKAREVAGEVEGWLDDFCLDKKSSVKAVEDFVNLFKSYELKAPHMRYMQSSFDRRANEIIEAVAGQDKDLAEGYSNFTKPELKKLSLFYSNLLKACTMLQEVGKATRTPRTRKPVSQEKIVSKVKYKKDDSSLGIVSIGPVHLLNSKEVWTFNTKTRKLSRFIADELQGPISVKGTTLIGYNEVKSISKTLRKPAEQLAEFKKASKVQLRTFMDGIKAVEIGANGRMNEDIIILKVLS